MPTVTVTNPGTLANYDGDIVNVSISASDSDENALSYSASGLPAGLSIDPSYGIISGTVSAGDYATSPYSVTVTATDNTESQSASQTFTWNISEPTITVTNPGMQTNYDGDSISRGVEESHTGYGGVSYSETGLPPGLSIDPESGIISGTIADGADTGSPYEVTVIVSDAIDGVSASQNFDWYVNNPVSSTAPANQTNYDGDTGISVSFSASDAEGNSLNYAASNLPSGLSIDPSAGTITGTIANTADQSSPSSVTVTATDSVNGASSSQTFTWTVNNPVSSTGPSDQTNFDGDTVSLPFSASDAESNTLDYSATNLPSGLSIDPAAGTITGTISSGADTSSPYSVTVTATDSVNGASSSQTFNWTVNPNPVSLTQPSDQSNYDGDTVSLGLSASDADSNSLTYTASGLPSGLTIDSTTGIISGTIASTADTTSPYAVTVTALDSVNGASVTQPFNWTVSPVTVSLTSPGDQTNYDADTVSLQLSATDSASHDLSYSVTGGALPSGLSLSSSGLISGTIGDTADTGSVYSVTVTATDSPADVSDTQTFNWTVNNPVAVTNPGDQTNFDGDAGISLQLSASDADGNSIIYSITSGSLPTGLSLNTSTGLISGDISSTADTSSPYSITVTAADSVNTGVTNSQTFTWTVAQPTLLLSSPSEYDNLDGDVVTSDTLLEYDNATSHTVSYSVTGLPTGLGIDSSTGVISGTVSGTADASSPYSVTVTVTDSAASLSASQTFNWEIDPSLYAGITGDQTNCIGDTPDVDASATDVAGNSVGYTASGLPPGLSIDSSSGAITGTVSGSAVLGTPYSVTVTATDGTTGVAVDETFNWTIVEINVANPGDQYSLDADAINFSTAGSTSYSSTDALVYSASGLPSGISINSTTGVISGTMADNADTSSPYSITVTLTDSTVGQSSSQTFSWIVAAPTTYNDDLSLATTENEAIPEIDLTRDSNNPDDPSMVTNIISGPSNGTLAQNGDGTYTYTPNTGFTGSDSFTFDVVVGDPVTSNTSTITITVAADIPTIGPNITYATLPGNALALNDLANNATDSAGTSLTAQIVSGPSNGTLTPNGSGGYTYQPNAGFTGTDTFTYNVTNGTNTSSGTATVTINVTASNPLVANPVFVQTQISQSATISLSSLLANAQSASGATVSLCSYMAPTNGTLTWSGGNLVYTPNVGFTGTDEAVLTFTDGTNTTTAKVYMTVAQVEPTPALGTLRSVTDPMSTGIVIGVIQALDRQLGSDIFLTRARATRQLRVISQQYPDLIELVFSTTPSASPEQTSRRLNILRYSAEYQEWLRSRPVP